MKKKANKMKPAGKTVNRGRHEANCKLCSHPDRERIEVEWIAWANTSKLAKKYKVSRDSIYRHVAAFNLRDKRGKNLRAALERIIEQSDLVSVNASAVVSPDLQGTLPTSARTGAGRINFFGRAHR